MERMAREVWAERVAKLKESGLTLKEFASQLGINHRSLAWWKWQLASKVPGTSSEGRRGRQARTPMKTAISPVTFVEMAAATETDRLEIVVSSSVRIHIRPGFDAATLGRLLDVLEGRR